jgi:hypothetical protein
VNIAQIRANCAKKNSLIQNASSVSKLHGELTWKMNQREGSLLLVVSLSSGDS